MSTLNWLLTHNGKRKKLKFLFQRKIKSKKKPQPKRARRTKIKTLSKKKNKKLSTFLTTSKTNSRPWKYWLHQALNKSTRRLNNWEIAKDCLKDAVLRSKSQKQTLKCWKKSKPRRPASQEQLLRRKSKLRKNSQQSDSIDKMKLWYYGPIYIFIAHPINEINGIYQNLFAINVTRDF